MLHPASVSTLSSKRVDPSISPFVSSSAFRISVYEMFTVKSVCNTIQDGLTTANIFSESFSERSEHLNSHSMQREVLWLNHEGAFLSASFYFIF